MALRAEASPKPASQSMACVVAAGGDGDGGGGDGGGEGLGGGGDGDGGGGDGDGGEGLGGGGDGDGGGGDGLGGGGDGEGSETGQPRNVVMPLSLPSSGELVPDVAYASNCVV